MKVFISSTYKDLIDYRTATIRAVEGTSYQASKMEVFGARPDEPLEACLREVEESDLFIGIYALRYGFVPEGADISITELEYLHAKKLGRPIYCFILDEENQPWLNKWIEDEPGKSKLKNFKQRIQKDHVCDYYTTSDDLRAKVANALSHYLVRNLLASDSEFTTPYSQPKPKGSTLPSQAYFFGRKQELAIIAEAILPESRTWGALIDGPGGIGKTALAIHAADIASDLVFDNKIFISAKIKELTPAGEKLLTDFTRADYLALLNELALELGEKDIQKLAPEERPNFLRISLQGKRVLMIFDNLESLHENDRTRLFQFLGRLPQGNKAIVTSRLRTDVEARIIRLDRLRLNEAMELIAEISKSNPLLARSNARERHKLYEVTNGNPLLIKWVTGQLGRKGSHFRTLNEAYGIIDQANRFNDPLEFIFGDLLNSSTDNEKVILAALSFFSRPAKLSWISQITGLSESIVEASLNDLVYRSILVSDHEYHEFYLPPLNSRFIQNKHPNLVRSFGKQIKQRAHKLIVRFPFNQRTDKQARFSYLEEQWPTIQSALPIFEAEAYRFSEIYYVLSDFLEMTGRWDELIWICEIAERFEVEAVKKYNSTWLAKLFKADTYDAGKFAYRAGWLYYLRGQTTNLISASERVTEYWQSEGALQWAAALRLSGLASMAKGDYSKARDAFRDGLKLWNKNQRPKEVAVALSDLATVELAIGNYDEAERNLDEALDISNAIGNQDEIAAQTGRLAEIALRKENWRRAKILASKALEMAKTNKLQDRIAINCLRVAKSLLNQNMLTESLPYAQQAKEIFTSLHSRYLSEAEEILIIIESKIKDSDSDH
jgi:tetratricopeptide (TPR) repeat protein